MLREIIAAITTGDLDELKRLRQHDLDQFNIAKNERDLESDHGDSALATAAREEKPEIFAWLLDVGADAEWTAEDDPLYSILHHACRGGCLEILNVLQDKNSELVQRVINQSDGDGEKPFEGLIRENVDEPGGYTIEESDAFISPFLEWFLNQDGYDNSHMVTFLLHRSYIDCVKLFYKKKPETFACEINKKDRDGEIPLERYILDLEDGEDELCIREHKELDWLLDLDCVTNHSHPDAPLFSIVHLLSWVCHLYGLKALKEKKPKLFQKLIHQRAGNRRATPLINSLFGQQFSMGGYECPTHNKWLIDQGGVDVDWRKVGDNRYTVVHLVAKLTSTETLKIIETREPEFYKLMYFRKDKRGESPATLRQKRGEVINVFKMSNQLVDTQSFADALQELVNTDQYLVTLIEKNVVKKSQEKEFHPLLNQCRSLATIFTNIMFGNIAWNRFEFMCLSLLVKFNIIANTLDSDIWPVERIVYFLQNVLLEPEKYAWWFTYCADVVGLQLSDDADVQQQLRHHITRQWYWTHIAENDSRQCAAQIAPCICEELDENGWLSAIESDIKNYQQQLTKLITNKIFSAIHTLGIKHIKTATEAEVDKLVEQVATNVANTKGSYLNYSELKKIMEPIIKNKLNVNATSNNSSSHTGAKRKRYSGPLIRI